MEIQSHDPRFDIHRNMCHILLSSLKMYLKLMTKTFGINQRHKTSILYEKYLEISENVIYRCSLIYFSIIHTDLLNKYLQSPNMVKRLHSIINVLVVVKVH